MIKKVGEKYYLYSKDGKRILGRFRTRKAAMKREKQVAFYKNKG